MYHNDMADLNKKQIEKLVHLSKLKLTDSESETIGKELSDTVGYFGKLLEVDISNTKPTSQTTGFEDILRPDQIDDTRTLPADSALSGSDEVHNNYFLVDRLIEKTGNEWSTKNY